MWPETTDAQQIMETYENFIFPRLNEVEAKLMKKAKIERTPIKFIKTD